MTALVKVLSESFFNTSFPASIMGDKVTGFFEQNSRRVLSVVSGYLLKPPMMVEQVCCLTSWTTISLVLPFCTHFNRFLRKIRVHCSLTVPIIVQKENESVSLLKTSLVMKSEERRPYLFTNKILLCNLTHHSQSPSPKSNQTNQGWQPIQVHSPL